MVRKILYFLLCLPVICFAVLCHLFPNMALNGFVILSLLQVLLGLFFYRKGDTSAVILLIFLEGLALKLFYIAYTPYTVRQHDIEEFSDKYKGHFGYIYYIIKNHTIPAFIQKPFYPFSHPPLHYLLSVLFLSVFSGFENLQYMTLIWSFGLSIVSYFLVKLFVQKKGYLFLIALFFNFFPASTFYSGSLNNDILASLVIGSSIFFFVCYLKRTKNSFLLLSAFLLGISGLVKIQAIPVYVGVTLFYISSVLLHQMKFKKAVRELLLFSLICLPILLFWPVYNYIRWNGHSIFSTHLWWHMGSWGETLSFWFGGYNPFLHIENYTTDKYQYIGAYSLWERFGPIFEPITFPWLLVGNWYSQMIPEYNVWTGLLKTALFDEWNLFLMGATFIETIGFELSVILLGLSYVLFFFCLIAFFKVSKKDSVALYCRCIIVAVMAGFIYWCLKNPAYSAISFRYISFLLPCLSLLLVKYIQGNLEKDTPWNRGLKNLLGATVFLFSWISLIIYTLYGATAF